MKLTLRNLLRLLSILLVLHGILTIYTAIRPPSSLQDVPLPTPSTQSIQPKPIVLLVPGHATSSVLLPGTGDDGFICTAEATPVKVGDNHTYFSDLPVWLQEDGWIDIRLVGLDNNKRNTPSILENAKCLRRQILQATEESPTGQVVLIAHSMGGLVARAYVQSDEFEIDTELAGIAPVRYVFLIAAPNQGMPFYSWLRILLDCESPDTSQRAACEFSNSNWVEDFNAEFSSVPEGVDFYTIGGTLHNGWLGFLSGCYICFAAGPNDGTIPTKSSVGFAGARGSAYYPESHLPEVGLPSFFKTYLGRESLTYANCIYPVLFGGNLDGCQGKTELRCPSAFALVTFVIEIISCIIILTFSKRVKR